MNENLDEGPYPNAEALIDPAWCPPTCRDDVETAPEPERPVDDLSYVWQWQVLQDGRWGLIVGFVPMVNGMAPLSARDPERARAFEPLAMNHREKSGLPVRLARFRFEAVEVELP